MKSIIVAEDDFNRLFDETSNKLKLDLLTHSNKYETTDEIHRKFHYELFMLKDALLKAK
jgi:hypothetical protein